MKAPRTSNSITERVVYTGLYVPEPAWHEESESATPEARSAEGESEPERLEA
jgi:hypothetical protein